jgi:uncharacterized coiled-coil DUF342 family protein
MKRTLAIIISVVLGLGVLGGTVISLRQYSKASGPGPQDELKTRSELIAKSLARSLSDPLANADDLALSELMAQSKADYPEVNEIFAVNSKGMVAVSSVDEAAGKELSLPDGIKRLEDEPLLMQPGASSSNERSYWTAVPVLLGKEKIGSLYLLTKGTPQAGSSAAGVLPVPLMAGQALALVVIILLLALSAPKKVTVATAGEALAEFEHKKKEIEKDLENKRKDLKKVEAEAADHTRWLEMFRGEEADLTSQVKRLRQERTELEGTIEQGRKQLVEFEGLLRTKQSKLEEVSHQLTARIEEGIELDKRLEIIQQQEAELNTRMAELKKGEANLAQWLKQSKAEVQNLVQFIAEKRLEESELEQTVEERKREAAELEERVNQVRGEIQELSDICEQWTQEKERLAGELGEKQKDLTAVMQLLEGSRARLDKLQRQETGTK